MSLSVRPRKRKREESPAKVDAPPIDSRRAFFRSPAFFNYLYVCRALENTQDSMRLSSLAEALRLEDQHSNYVLALPEFEKGTMDHRVLPSVENRDPYIHPSRQLHGALYWLFSIRKSTKSVDENIDCMFRLLVVRCGDGLLDEDAFAAAVSGQFGVATLAEFIRVGVDVNQCDADGETRLMHAVDHLPSQHSRDSWNRQPQPTVLVLLLSCAGSGLLLNATDCNGNTAWQRWKEISSQVQPHIVTLVDQLFHDADIRYTEYVRTLRLSLPTIVNMPLPLVDAILNYLPL